MTLLAPRSGDQALLARRPRGARARRRHARARAAATSSPSGAGAAPASRRCCASPPAWSAPTRASSSSRARPWPTARAPSWPSCCASASASSSARARRSSRCRCSTTSRCRCSADSGGWRRTGAPPQALRRVGAAECADLTWDAPVRRRPGAGGDRSRDRARPVAGLADDPSAGLDAIEREHVVALLRNAADEAGIGRAA